jgi:nucleotide-binding universal stress UspA family protein
MNKRILLGIDANFSPATQQALHTVSEFMQQATPLLRLVLLNVIPIPAIASPSLGLYAGQFQSLSVTPEQRTQAEDSLWRARAELQKQGIASGQIEVLIRVGLPADEIVRAAQELQVDFIVIGSRGNSLGQRIRRFFAGSISRKVLHTASCPVMIVASPLIPQQCHPERSEGSRTHHPADLVKWYEEAITRYLQEHTSALTVFTPLQVAQTFAPAKRKAPKRKEVAAATLALEQLARNGVLCRHEVKGELRYIND